MKGWRAWSTASQKSIEHHTDSRTDPAGGCDGPRRPGAAAPPRRRPLPAARRSPRARRAGAAQSLQFSKHALDRVQRRGIDLDDATLSRLSAGVGRAASKGSRDSLVLADGTAFVVSVSNRTVITAVGAQHMKTTCSQTSTAP